MNFADQIRGSVLEHKAQQRALQYVQTQTKDELRKLIAETTAGVSVRRVDPALADGALTWGPTQSWTGSR